MVKFKSKGQVQPSQDNRDNMVKKLEKSSNSTIFAPQQDQAKEESLVQVKRSNMESKNKTKLSRKEKQHARTRVCFRCKEKGHLITACPIQQSEVRSDPTGQTGHPRPVRPVGAQKAQSHSYKSKLNENSRVMPEVRQVQRSTASQKHKKNNKSTFVELKHRICYTGRAKGHMGKDCPNGNELNSNLVHYYFTKLRKDQAGTCA